MIDLKWYKLGFENYNYYLSRKYLCYSGKRITFQYNISFFQSVMIGFFDILHPCKDMSYNEYLKEYFNA